MEWVAKYIFRLGHIGPVVLIGGKLLIDYLTYPNTPLKNNEKWNDIFGILTIVMGVSGYINSMLLKPKKNLQQKRIPWTILVHVKLLSLAFYFDRFTSLIFKDEKKVVTLRLHLALFWIVLSPALRYYREYYTQKLQSTK